MTALATLRQLVATDADEAFDYLLAEAPQGTAANLVEALQQAFDHLSEHPLTGPFRFAFELDIPEMRTWSLNRFPYLVFYVFYVCNDDHVDIWRILHTHTHTHTHRDIPASTGDG